MAIGRSDNIDACSDAVSALLLLSESPSPRKRSHLGTITNNVEPQYRHRPLPGSPNKRKRRSAVADAPVPPTSATTSSRSGLGDTSDTNALDKLTVRDTGFDAARSSTNLLVLRRQMASYHRVRQLRPGVANSSPRPLRTPLSVKAKQPAVHPSFATAGSSKTLANPAL